MAGAHQVDGARRAIGHGMGGASQFHALWVVGAERPGAGEGRQARLIRPFQLAQSTVAPLTTPAL